MSVLAAMAVGLAAGATAGLMGIGGGILFVPALAIFLDKTQIEAEATSLLAIIPVAIVGAWRQAHYGNVRLADANLVRLSASHSIPPSIGECRCSMTVPMPSYMCTPHGRHGSKLRTVRMMSMPLNLSGPFSSKIFSPWTASS